MSTVRVQLRKPHEAQRQILSEARRFNVVDCGRRWGKSVMGIDRLVVPAIEGRPVAWFSPSYKMLLEIWRDIAGTLKPLTSRKSDSEFRIELVTGGVVEAWSLDNPDAGRSRRYQRVVVDEAAMCPHLGESWRKAIRPTLADFRGDAWFLSSPKGRNFFWEMFCRGQDPLFPDWASWQMPTRTNPFIHPDEIEAARLETPERDFAQEYLAEFLDDAGGVFRYVRRAVRAQKQEQAITGHDYVIGADWGRENDFSAFSVVDCHLGECCHLERSNKVEYETQIGRLMGLVEKFKPVAIIAEENSIGGPVIEQIRRRKTLDGKFIVVRPFKTTNASKQAMIDALALAFEQDTIGLIDDQVLIDELQNYQMQRLPSGLMRFSAPEGLHDDTVIALGLAWMAASERKGLAELARAMRERNNR